MLGTAVLTMVVSRLCMKNAAATSQIRPRNFALSNSVCVGAAAVRGGDECEGISVILAVQHACSSRARRLRAAQVHAEGRSAAAEAAPGLRRPGRETDAGEGEGEDNKQPAHEGCSRHCPAVLGTAISPCRRVCAEDLSAGFRRVLASE